MCEFFSFVTEPEKHGGKRYYFNWDQRTSLGLEDYDTHSGICKWYLLDEDICNKYEYNPLTQEFTVDQINSEVDDRVQAEEWVRLLDWKRIIEPLIIKPIVNPLNLDAPKVGEEQVELLRSSVRASVGASVWSSVWDSVGVYVGSFFDLQYTFDISSVVTLWEQGFVPSFDGTTWRLHAGKDAKIVYEMECGR